MSSDKKENQVAAIPAEVGKTCDPYDGEQERYERTLGDERLDVELPSEAVGCPEDYLAAVAYSGSRLEGFAEYTQDMISAIMQNLITKYVFIRDTYKFTTAFSQASLEDFISKLIPLIKTNVQLNNYVNDEKINNLAVAIGNDIANHPAFNSDRYISLTTMIIEELIPDFNPTLTSYREQYISQMKEMVIPNMVEDVMIHFNSPEDNIDDILGFIADDQPDAQKYKIVKNDDKQYTIVIFGIEDGVNRVIPALYVLDEIHNNGEKSYKLTSRVTTDEEVSELLDMYVDSSRWSL